MQLNVHRSTIYNSQGMEATQLSINREMDRDVIYIVQYYSAIKRIKFFHLWQPG